MSGRGVMEQLFVVCTFVAGTEYMAKWVKVDNLRDFV